MWVEKKNNIYHNHSFWPQYHLQQLLHLKKETIIIVYSSYKYRLLTDLAIINNY